MSNNQCPAITKAGTRCPNTVMNGKKFCFSHEQSIADKRRDASRRGGRNKANAVRAQKAIPADLRDVSDVLLHAIRDVESGDLDTSKASALATLSRAYVAVYEAGLIESRIREIEARIDAKTASTAERNAS